MELRDFSTLFSMLQRDVSTLALLSTAERTSSKAYSDQNHWQQTVYNSHYKNVANNSGQTVPNFKIILNHKMTNIDAIFITGLIWTFVSITHRKI